MTAYIKLSAISAAFLLASGALYAAEPVGKVVIMQGTANVQRGGDSIPLNRGSSVESGDLIRVGDQSSLQVRFSDDSMVALRAQTEFKVDNFSYQTDKPADDRSTFSLVRGGMRAITGAIGKRNRDAFEVKATTASIGIRGTNFTAVNCTGSCFNPDGSRAEDGLYGTVTEGRIVVRNSAGETEFSRDQHFSVSSTTSPPRRLLSPPHFVRDRLEGQSSRRQASQTASTAAPSSVSTTETPTGSQTASTGAGTVTADTTISATTPISQTPDPLTSSASATTPSVTQFASTSTGTSSNLTGTTSLTGGSSAPFAFSAAIGSISLYNDVFDGTSEAFQFSGTLNTTTPIANVSTVAGLASYLQNAFSGTYSYSYFDSEYQQTRTGTATQTKEASVDTGFSGPAGNVYWGRYSATETWTDNLGSGTDQWTDHWAIGDPVTAMPTSGTFTYNWVGGTRPVDQYGNVGTMRTNGSWAVTFGTNTIQTLTDITWTMPGSQGYYGVAVPSQNFTVSTSNVSTGLGTGTATLIDLARGAIDATGAIASSQIYPPSVSITGFGTQMQGLGASINVISNGLNMSTVQVYAR